MNYTKEEIGATAGSAIYALVLVIGWFQDVSPMESCFRGVVCAIPTLLLGQFLGGMWVKASEQSQQGGG